MRLLIAGDLAPTSSNIDLFIKADLITLLGEELLSQWNSADLRIFNLEVPLTDKETPIMKCGPNLLAPTSTVNVIKALNPSLLTLSNNHILDQGDKGLKSTKDLLAEYNIPFVGIGDNLSEASQPYIIRKNELKIGVYACAEHEFSIATKKSSGANPFDPLESLEHIQRLKDQCDYTIVLYHGGKEHYRYPSPSLQNICQNIVNKGADLVVCQHSHSIGCFEEYNNSTIIYGQGNFIFDYSNNEYWQTSFILDIEINNGLNVHYIPILKKNNGIRLATEKVANDILSSFQKRSHEILQEGFIEKEYQKFANENIQNYLRHFSGMGKWLSRFDRYLFRGKIINSRYSKRQLLTIQNFVECEAHRELLIEGLRRKN